MNNEAHKANSFVMHMKNTSYFNSTLLYRQSCEEQEAGAALLRSPSHTAQLGSLSHATHSAPPPRPSHRSLSPMTSRMIVSMTTSTGARTMSAAALSLGVFCRLTMQNLAASCGSDPAGSMRSEVPRVSTRSARLGRVGVGVGVRVRMSTRSACLHGAEGAEAAGRARGREDAGRAQGGRRERGRWEGAERGHGGGRAGVTCSAPLTCRARPQAAGLPNRVGCRAARPCTPCTCPELGGWGWG
eukprot:scaffold25756_cov66-Phaeocystis_antarctica.AAC.3